MIISIATIFFGYHIIFAEKVPKYNKRINITFMMDSFLILLTSVYIIFQRNTSPFTGYITEYAVILFITIMMFYMTITPKSNKVSNSNENIEEEDRILSTGGLLITDPISRIFLRAYMLTLLQGESIIFWEAVDELERLIPKLNNSKLRKYCKEIYEKFIVDGSDMEININAKMKKKIKEEIAESVYIFYIIAL